MNGRRVRVVDLQDLSAAGSPTSFFSWNKMGRALELGRGGGRWEHGRDV